MSLTISAFSVLRCGKMRHRVRKCQISGFCCCYPKEISIRSPSSCNLRCKVGSPRCFLMLLFPESFRVYFASQREHGTEQEERPETPNNSHAVNKQNTQRAVNFTTIEKLLLFFFRVCCKTFISLGCKQNYYFCTEAVFQQFSRWHGSLVSMTSELDRMARKSLPLSRF